MMPINRRLRWAGFQLLGTTLRVCVTIYSLISLSLLGTVVGLWLTFEPSLLLNSDSAIHSVFYSTSLAMVITHIIGICLLLYAVGKCHNCISGPVRRVIDAMGKMSRGDLGWKITLRKNDELSEMAASITNASCSLAERIGRLQTQARELNEVEDYIIDAVSVDRTDNRHLIKGLRKLKITTSRLNSDIDSFQISAVNFPDRPNIIGLSRPSNLSRTSGSDQSEKQTVSESLRDKIEV